MSDLHLFAFNEKDVLVSITALKNVNLDRNNQTLVPLTNGYFSFVGMGRGERQVHRFILH
ncbi:MAG: hypothetical protein ACOX19_12915 [Fermentimonas sp.]